MLGLLISATALHGALFSTAIASLIIAQDYLLFIYSSQKRCLVTSPAALRKREK